MKRRLIDKFVDMLMVGNRPIRIFFFGGVFIAYIAMKVLGKVLGLDTNMGGDIDLPNIILMTVSILTGFGFSFSLIRWLENAKQSREDSDHE